ncbi:hypothetical protein GCM10028807_58380 [Spirosoma daeguense]
MPNVNPKVYFVLAAEADKPVVWQDRIFTFLNRSVCFPGKIDWNYAKQGKLWTYQLNYFDCLNQPNVSPESGLLLIHDFIVQTPQLRDGLEAYPTSLRIMNWVQFLSRYQIHDSVVNAHLFAQAGLLRQRLEYHLMGNHLLENGFALLAAALFYQKNDWYRSATNVIRTELSGQILADGCHDERSLMYHQILLDRLLIIWPMMMHDKWHNDPEFTNFLAEKTTRMLSWLERSTFRNGDIPMVNDATFGIAPTAAQLRQKFQLTNSRTDESIKTINDQNDTYRHLESGYRMFRQSAYELFVDVGAVGPDHQPGHAHADTFSFILHVNNKPVFVDAGTSTYQIGAQRDWERSTAAHNTVEINGINSSEVWGGFRVGRRARVKILLETTAKLIAQHDGYQPYGIMHERSWTVESNLLRITDQLLDIDGQRIDNQLGVARFYAHPSTSFTILGGVVKVDLIHISFESVTNVSFCVTEYHMAQGFNLLQAAQCLEVIFTGLLETVIMFPE